MLRNARKTFWVVILTAIMMVIEIGAGYMTDSMALLADGWHMATHAGALAITLMAYKFALSPKMNRNFSFGAGKLIPLGGYTSAIILAIVAILMAVESVKRLISPLSIQFNEAIGVAIIGLVVNLVCAFILNDKEHADHSHVHDHNLRSAYFHVVADAFTSILAIGALLLGKYFGLVWADALVGLLGSAVILKWAYGLCKDTCWELLDGHSNTVDWAKLRSLIETDGTKIVDFHVWRIAPKALACELVVTANQCRGTEHYRSILNQEFGLNHIIIEERTY